MNQITENGIHYNIEETRAVLHSCEELEGEVSIPNYVENLPVTEAEPYVFSRKKITELELPIYLEKVGRYAFYRCFALWKLRFSDYLMDIGAGAFTGCNPKEIVIDFYDGEKPCLKFIADEIRYAFRVEMNFYKTSTLVDKAVVYFPEHYEEAVENTPARIVETHYHGSGGDYRQCFYNKELNFAEYDSLFYRALAEESEEMVVDIASARLRYPYKLNEASKERYELYLKEHMKCAGSRFVQREDMEMLQFFCKAGYFTKETLETTIEVAAEERKTEILSMLMDEKRRLFPAKKKVFEF